MVEYKLSLGGCLCSVVEWNPDGSTLVFALHGWLDNLASFESLVKYMPNIRLIAIDFPGHGHSDHLPADLAYHFIDGLYLIDDLLNHFKLSKINLLGHSMGGAISTLYAASQASKVEKLVLIESIGPLTTDSGQAVSLLKKAVEQRAILKNKRKPVYEDFKSALKARADASQIDAELIKPLVERALVNVENGYTWRADSRLRVATPIRMSEPHFQQIIPEITASVLLIEGDSGLLVDKEVQARKLLFKDLEQYCLSGGHHVHLEQTENCANKIQTFFASSV